jgi:hypothetical protein
MVQRAAINKKCNYANVDVNSEQNIVRSVRSVWRGGPLRARSNHTVTESR